MKKSCLLILLLALMLPWSCNTKSGQDTRETTVSQDSTSVSQNENSDNDSTKTWVLKWKSVSTSEYGNTYEFEDESGQGVEASRLGIPDFDEDNNLFFTRTPVEGTPFSMYEIRESIKDKWFRVKMVTTQEENSNAGDGSMTDVVTIVDIKPR